MQTTTDSSSNPVSSSAPAAFPPFFRRRTLGRAPSPPTWACYEQIPPPTSDSDEDDAYSDTDSQSGSDSEVEAGHESQHPHADSCSIGGEMEMEMQVGEPKIVAQAVHTERMDVDEHVNGNKNAANDEHTCGSAGEQCDDDDCMQQPKRHDKGKQRAIEPEPEHETDAYPLEKSPKHRHHRKRRHHEAPFVYRPILTIKKSEGFVWNQDLFVPSYIKDRYIASTSPPSSGFNNTPSSSVPGREFHDGYEVEVVEIRVQGNELDAILS